MQKFVFGRKKKREKFYFFIDFLSNNPIHNLKEIIKFLEKMDFQNKGWRLGYRNFQIMEKLSIEKGHRLV